MREFWEFFCACFGTTVSLITGGFLALYLTILVFYPPNHPPPAGILWGAITIYFFWAAFVAWRKERRRALKAEEPTFSRETADFVGKRIAALDDAQKCILKDFAIGGIMTAIQATEPYKKHPTDIFGIKQAGLIHEISDAYYQIDLAYQAAIQKYFVDHPIAVSNSSNSLT